ncbi:MAG: hypothetical protein IPH51_12820 [Rubrivivax sp.]|nr:hypothetical protein [Rubrivivax sp.]
MNSAGNPVVKVEIDALGDLKDLRSKGTLDLRGWRADQGVMRSLTPNRQRPLDAAPAQVRGPLQTEGYFAPETSVQRLPAPPAPGLPETVHLRVTTGPRDPVRA